MSSDAAVDPVAGGPAGEELPEPPERAVDDEARRDAEPAQSTEDAGMPVAAREQAASVDEPVEALAPDAEASPVETVADDAARAEIPVDDGDLIEGTGVSRSEPVAPEPEAVTVSDAEIAADGPSPDASEPSAAADWDREADLAAAAGAAPDKGATTSEEASAAPEAAAPTPDGDMAVPDVAVAALDEMSAAPTVAALAPDGEIATRDEDVAAPVELAEPVAEPEVIEPVLIEVWRPHRTNHHAQRRPDGRGARRDGRPDARRDSAAMRPLGEVAAAPEGAPAERRDDRRFQRPDGRGPNSRPGGGDRRSDRRPQVVAAGDGNAPSAGIAAASTEERAPRPARDVVARNGAEKPRFDGRRNGGPRGDGRRDDARGEGHREGRSAPTVSNDPRPAPRERQPDPNSPFAKLMALKLELERGKKET